VRQKKVRSSMESGHYDVSDLRGVTDVASKGFARSWQFSAFDWLKQRRAGVLLFQEA